MGPTVPCAELHARAAQQILSNDFLRRPFWMPLAELLEALLAGLLLSFLLPRWDIVRGAWIVCAVIAAMIAGTATLFLAGWLIDAVFPCAASLVVYVVSVSIGFAQSETDRRRLAVLDQVKDEFVAMVSHDLRGPVSAIISVIGSAEADEADPLSPRHRKALKLIRECCRSLTNFVGNILDGAKIKAGRMEYRMSKIQAQDWIPALTELFGFGAQLRKIKIDMDVPKDLPPLYGDRERLEQVLNNLLTNALKFTPAGGRITVLAEAGPGFVTCTVRDTGIGIPSGQIHRLFKRFEQLDPQGPNERRSGGTGLGLAVCREIVEAHGGKIWAESEEGKGSSFRFSIPRGD